MARRSLYEKFWARARKTAGCWEWTGTTNEGGYGRLTTSSRPLGQKKDKSTAYLAHRLAYETMIGLIPEGLDVTQTCRNRLCVNPTHLEVVTRSEALCRGHQARRAREESQPTATKGRGGWWQMGA